MFLMAVTIFAVSCVYAATRCNKWVGSEEVYGKLCITHGFGAKADNCVVCGKWVGLVLHQHVRTPFPISRLP